MIRPPQRWLRRVLLSPPMRIIYFMVLVAALGAITSMIFGALGWSAKTAPIPQKIAANLLGQAGSMVGAYLLLAWLVEKRKVTELAPRTLVPMGVAGMAGGATLALLVIGVLWLAGSYRVTGTHEDVQWAFQLLDVGLATAIGEEVIFRGILFRLLEEWLGFGWALAISALFFGAVHLSNPGATPWTSFAIAVEAGILLGVVFHVTRSLAACIGLHFAWNFLEGAVFGSAVSGVARTGWLSAEFPGPDWLTGGGFGIEASVLTVAFSLIGSALLLLSARRGRASDNEPVAAGA